MHVPWKLCGGQYMQSPRPALYGIFMLLMEACIPSYQQGVHNLYKPRQLTRFHGRDLL